MFKMVSGQLEGMCHSIVSNNLASWDLENNVCQNRPEGKGRHFARGRKQKENNWKVNSVCACSPLCMCVQID